MKNIFKTIIVASAIYFSFAICSCKKKDTVPLDENIVWLQNTGFTPSLKTISNGTTITFINKDNMTHTVSETSNLFTSSGDLKHNDTFVVTFSTAGIYHIYCKYHASMLGTITVQ